MTSERKLKCEICGTTFRSNNGSVILTEESFVIGICPSCHEDVYQDGLRYEVDVMIIPVSEESFKIAKRFKKYISPNVRRRPKFIAFYRPDVKAITHISRVSKIILNVSRSEVKDLFNKQKHSSWMDAEEFDMFEILTPIMLRHKIERKGASTIQNRVYKTFNEFSKARKIKDLYLRKKLL